jgi:neutral ceramidase
VRRWLKGFLIFLAACATILLLLVGSIDHTPLPEQEYYQAMMSRLDSLQTKQYSPSQKLKAGWGKVNITPNHSMPMAGYRIRPGFDTVHVSLYARVIGINNGAATVYFISVDLLLFPPALKEKLNERVAEFSSKPFLYYSATHTHNGIGGWNNSVAGEFILGNYDESWVLNTTEKLVTQLKSIEQTMQSAQLSYWQADAHEYAENRLLAGAPHDGWLRGLKLVRADSSEARLITFSAHATSISKKSKSLSGDYPSALIGELEMKKNTFGMFMAGMVGSHRLAGLNATDFELVAQAGMVLAEKISLATTNMQIDSVEIQTAHVPIIFGPAQLRLTKDLKLRNWIFSSMLDPLQGELTYVELGNIIFIGTPCDFSGEIFVTQQLAELAASNNKQLIITSFNGDYAGYITEDTHYQQVEREEVMTMNWVGPNYGTYFTEMISVLIKK